MSSSKLFWRGVPVSNTLLFAYCAELIYTGENDNCLPAGGKRLAILCTHAHAQQNFHF